MANSLNFTIPKLDSNLKKEIQQKIDQKTKPLGSLGKLEEYALRITLIQNDYTPRFTKPYILVFAGDHGLAQEKISPFPQEVTFQMVMNFLSGGAAINAFCNENRLALKVIDSGVNFNFENTEGLIDAKVNFGTKNILYEEAMTEAECLTAIQRGASIVSQIEDLGSNLVGFGEMGIGNTGISSLLMSRILNIPLEECTGRGTGCTDSQLVHKIQVLKKVSSLHKTSDSVLDILRSMGGFEIAMIVGGILRAAENKMTILIDGFIVSVACLIAKKLYPEVMDYCFFSHVSSEKAHDILLRNLNVKPILNLDLRLGEGTGAALAYPILASSARFMHDMASFNEAGVSNRK